MKSSHGPVLLIVTIGILLAPVAARLGELAASAPVSRPPAQDQPVSSPAVTLETVSAPKYSSLAGLFGEPESIPVQLPVPPTKAAAPASVTVHNDPLVGFAFNGVV